MSKKKVSGNTMTLKDFHGGSIPTDLPLPAAPGVTVRPLDRPAFDRPATWGSPIGRPDHCSRPHSSPATRNFNDKTPFLSHSVHIGRNFDEDERKPLDGSMAPRRTISDETIRIPQTCVEPTPNHEPTSTRQQGLAPPLYSHSSRVNETSRFNSQNSGGNGGKPNAWAARKEVAPGVNEPVQSDWAVPNPVSKLAHASALEKVSSGRWNSKQVMNFQTDIEVIGSSDLESSFQSSMGSYGHNSFNQVDDSILARHAERGLSIDEGIQGGCVTGQELPDYDRGVLVQKYTSVREINAKVDTELPQPRSSEPVDRLKLRLFPRTMPLDGPERTIVNHTQIAAADSHAEGVNEVYGNSSNPVKPTLVGMESGKQVVERPKLNLKPRTQPVEKLEGNTERERNALFGGARPRELVLKERGVDNIATDNHESIQYPERVENIAQRTERVVGQHSTVPPIHHTGKIENPPLDQRIGKKAAERKDNRVGGDLERRNWRNENRRSPRETEKQPQQQPQRAPSWDTWRKTIEQPKPASPDPATGSRYGKAASAVELAQAFSRSVSDSKTAVPSQRSSSVPGRTQMPFSRLTGPTPRPQINGY